MRAGLLSFWGLFGGSGCGREYQPGVPNGFLPASVGFLDGRFEQGKLLDRGIELGKVGDLDAERRAKDSGDVAEAVSARLS